MAADQGNPFLSTQKSDSGLHIALHPLVLLTISDYITRHTLRQQKGAIIGALLGQQNGLEVTLENAFECRVMGDGSPNILDEEWFDTRLQQMKDVHKAPALDLVGWYSVFPASGPQLLHATVQSQLCLLHPEVTICLGFHPEAVLEGSVGGKLPLTIYEATLEPLETGGPDDVEMTDYQPDPKVTFRELPYSVETGEAEMIGVDSVAKGGGNATAIDAIAKPAVADPATTSKGKKKQETEEEEVKDVENQNFLTREEEELVASLTVKANAIKMLHSRINLITAYLEKLPPSYIADGRIESPTEGDSSYSELNHEILRSIQALLNHLAILIPSDSVAFSRELLAEQNDVNLVNLLSTMTESIKGAREVGRKFAIVDQARNDKRGSRQAVNDVWTALNTSNDKGLGRTNRDLMT